MDFNFSSDFFFFLVNSFLSPVSASCHINKHVSANSDSEPFEVCHWHVILGQRHGCRPLRGCEQCGLCALRTKLVLWVSREDLEEGHLSTKTPPCYVFVRFWVYPCSSTNGKDAFLSETSLWVHFSTYSGGSETEKPCCHFFLFWRTWGKLFAQTIDTAAARKLFFTGTTTVSEVHDMSPDNPNI